MENISVASLDTSILTGQGFLFALADLQLRVIEIYGSLHVATQDR